MDKTTFLQTMDRSRNDFEGALERLSLQQCLQTGASGEMSVKDMLAHITWFEREMLGMLRLKALQGSEWWELSTDARNAEIFKLNIERTWEEIRAEANEIYPLLRQALEEIEEEAYFDAGYFQGMPADWVPWQVIAGNTFEHYDHHLGDLNAFLRSTED